MVARSIRLAVACSIIALSAMVAFGPGEAQGLSSGTTGNEPNPVVTGPVTGGLHGRPWFQAAFNPSNYGYSEKEYFYSGTAKAYGADDPAARYETRMLVFKPTDPAKFSGNVVVEWDNVTAQLDAPFDFDWVYPQIVAAGDAYVEITAQQAGVCGIGLTGQPILSLGQLSPAICTPTSLKGYDPLRYAPLIDPGDEYSYDIYSQGAQALRHPQGISPLGNLDIKQMIADGQSQSAVELDEYIETGADQAAQIFNGFLIDADAHDVHLAASYRVPTLHIWSEESAQPVSSTTAPNDVIWEVAGAPHLDAWSLQQVVAGVSGSLLNLPPNSAPQEQAAEQLNGDYGQEGPGLSATCAGDSQFPRRYAVDAALSDLETWVQSGVAAPSAPPLVFSGLAEATQPLPELGVNLGIPTANLNLLALGISPLGLVRDANGNAIGGLRLPTITVPVATYDGDTCVLLGTSVPFAPTQLQELYPTHADYVAKMTTATRASVTSRFMTVADGIDLMQRACSSAIPAWGITPTSQQPEECGNLSSLVSSAAPRTQ